MINRKEEEKGINGHYILSGDARVVEPMALSSSFMVTFPRAKEKNEQEMQIAVHDPTFQV